MFKELSLGYIVVDSFLIQKKKRKLAKMITRSHLLLLDFIRCLSLPLVVPLVGIRCHSLLFVVTRCPTRYQSVYHSPVFL